MKKTVSAHVYNTIERYPQILKTPKVEKAMGNLKCWMALRVNRGFDNSSYRYMLQITLLALETVLSGTIRFDTTKDFDPNEGEKFLQNLGCRHLTPENWWCFVQPTRCLFYV